MDFIPKLGIQTVRQSVPEISSEFGTLRILATFRHYFAHPAEACPDVANMKFWLAAETFHVSFVKSLSHIRWKTVTGPTGGRTGAGEDADPTDDDRRRDGGGNSEITFSISRNIEGSGRSRSMNQWNEK